MAVIFLQLHSLTTIALLRKFLAEELLLLALAHPARQVIRKPILKALLLLHFELL